MIGICCLDRNHRNDIESCNIIHDNCEMDRLKSMDKNLEKSIEIQRLQLENLTKSIDYLIGEVYNIHRKYDALYNMRLNQLKDELNLLKLSGNANLRKLIKLQRENRKKIAKELIEKKIYVKS